MASGLGLSHIVVSIPRNTATIASSRKTDPALLNMTTSSNANNGSIERTFEPVSLKHNFSVPGLYAFHAKHSPDHPVFSYADLESDQLHDISYADAWRDIRRIAAIVATHCPELEGTQKRQVIGIVAISGTYHDQQRLTMC